MDVPISTLIMLPTLDSLIDKFASKFRIEQRVDPDKMLLITESYLGHKLLYTHNMPLDPLYDLLRDRILKDLSSRVDSP